MGGIDFKRPLVALRTWFVLYVFLFGFACAQGEPDGSIPNPFLEGKTDSWDWINDPDRFARFLDEELEYNVFLLPAKGEATKKSWPASYWPTYEDSTNYRWEGEGTLSPLEKYDLVFNGWTPSSNFMDLVPYEPRCNSAYDASYYDAIGPAARWMSEKRGNWKARDGIDSDQDGEIDECIDRDGIESWWGLCHAWAPAAMLEPEPLYPVTVSGVTFHPSDIKALLITVYDRTHSMVIGGRCRADVVERDDNGRILDPDCRDTNAGSFHVVITNFLGLFRVAIGEDRTYDRQVWNQPVHGYEIEYLEEVDEKQALALLIVDPSTVSEYPFNEKAARWAEVVITVKYVTESNPSYVPLNDQHGKYLRTDRYHYILELDADGIIVGGEWIDAKATSSFGYFSHQPDFLWIPRARIQEDLTSPHGAVEPRVNPHVNYMRVKDLLEQSLVPPQ